MTIYIETPVIGNEEVGFTATPSSGNIPLLVTFSGIGGGRENPEFSWDFDDAGATDSGVVVTHTYNATGLYYPQVTILPSGVDSYLSNVDFSGLLEPLRIAESGNTNLFYDTTQWRYRQNNGGLMNVYKSPNAVDAGNLCFSGNFTLECGMQLGNPIELEYFSFGMSGVGTNYWLRLMANQFLPRFQIQGTSFSKFISASPNDICYAKFIRSGDYVDVYYDYGPSGSWSHHGNFSFPSGPSGCTHWYLKCSGIDSCSLLYARIEADSGLPYSGSPYTDYNTWWNMDLNNQSNFGIFNDYFLSGIYVDVSGNAPIGGTYSTHDVLSENFSGSFEIVNKIYTATNASHGFRIVDAGSTDDYLEVGYGRADNVIAAVFNYDEPNQSSVYATDPIDTQGLQPFNWWSKIKRVYNNVSGTYDYSCYWASGYLDSPSGTDWILIQSGALTAEWSTSTGTFDNVYLSLNAGDDWSILSYEVGEIYGTDTVSGLITVDNVDYIIDGFVSGIGYVSSSFTFIPKQIDPPDAGARLSTYMPILTNKKLYPYTIPEDTILSKFELYSNGRISYLANLPVEIWFNFEGSWQKYIDGTTNRYGIIENIQYSTTPIPNVDNCLGLAKVTINGTTYNSNLVRYNFIRQPSFVAFEIDAGDCLSPPVDRSAYDIFDSQSGRIDQFDRMYGVC